MKQVKQVKQVKEFAIELAKEAGKIALEKFGSSKIIREKRHDLKTEADLLTEEKILSKIRQRFPNHSIWSEEAGEIRGSSDYQWIIDPLDGTVNHWYGILHFCVSIALAKEKDKVMLGVVYDPIRKELFQAERGQGAYLNDKEINVSKRSLGNSIVATHLRYLDQVKRIASKVRRIRVLGVRAMDLCYVAAGRIDAYIGRKARLVDVAASNLIIEEAGGKVTDFKNKSWKPYDNLLATNGLIHDRLLEMIGDGSV